MAEKRTIQDDVDVRHELRTIKRHHNEQAALQPSQTAFLWEKKVEKDLREGRQVAVDEAEVLRQRHAELERIQLQRERYAQFQAEKKEQLSLDERRRFAEEAARELEKERTFHVHQHLHRARRRLAEGRGQPIDRLIQSLHLQAEYPITDPDFQPYTALKDMRVSEVTSLLEQAKEVADVDTDSDENRDYWAALISLMHWQIEAERAAESEDILAMQTGHAPAAKSALESVSDLVEEALRGDPEELQELKAQVDAELRDPSSVDPAFWAAVKPMLMRREAECLVSRIHRSRAAAAAATGDESLPDTRGAPASPHAVGPAPPDEDEDFDAPAWIELSDGRFSPPPEALRPTGPADGTVVKEAEDREAIALLRQHVRDELEQRKQQSQAVVPSAAPSTAAEQAMLSRAEAVLGASEFEWHFRGVVPLADKEYWWREQHRPRRPKFFNKVHTGYSWNKYNRAHYDVDNPPPKVVQGYKFNIFYPDLIDKSKAPTYRVIKDPSGDDATALLVFSAGAPYEDVAFRIVNKEWDRGPRKGFRNEFDRGMLQLYFNFKYTPYKR